MTGVHSTVDGSSVLPLLEALLVTHTNAVAEGAVWPVQRSKLMTGSHVGCPGLATKLSCTALLKSLSNAPARPVTRPVTLPCPGNATTPEG